MVQETTLVLVRLVPESNALPIGGLTVIIHHFTHLLHLLNLRLPELNALTQVPVRLLPDSQPLDQPFLSYGGSERPEYTRRRRSDVPPGPPPTFGPTPIIIEDRPEYARRCHRDPPRRSRPEIPVEPPRPPPAQPTVRRVPPGYVQPAPSLPPSERLYGNDLAGIAQDLDLKSNPQIRENVVLCVYRNSKKSFDYRFIKLISGHGGTDIVITDRLLFHSMRSSYENELRGWIRRFFSFKGLTTVRLLLVSNR
jgi:hypothetical protein